MSESGIVETLDYAHRQHIELLWASDQAYMVTRFRAKVRMVWGYRLKTWYVSNEAIDRGVADSMCLENLREFRRKYPLAHFARDSYNGSTVYNDPCWANSDPFCDAGYPTGDDRYTVTGDITQVTCDTCLRQYALAVLLGGVPLPPSIGLGGP